MDERVPRNIFEQILYGQLAVNDNVVALAKNVEVLADRVEDIMTLFSTKCVDVEKAKSVSSLSTD